MNLKLTNFTGYLKHCAVHILISSIHFLETLNNCIRYTVKIDPPDDTRPLLRKSVATRWAGYKLMSRLCNRVHARGVACSHVASNIVRPWPFSIALLLATALHSVNPPLVERYRSEDLPIALVALYSVKCYVNINTTDAIFVCLKNTFSQRVCYAVVLMADVVLCDGKHQKRLLYICFKPFN